MPQFANLGKLKQRRLYWLIGRLSAPLLGAFGSTLAADLPENALAELDFATFGVRELAQSELLKWGRLHPTDAKAGLHNLACQSTDPEVRVRCMDVLRELVIDDYLKEGNGYIGVALIDERIKPPHAAEFFNVIRVTKIQPDTPASRAAILLGDIILSLNGQTWIGSGGHSMFLAEIKSIKPNTKVTLQISRAGVITNVEVVLARRPFGLDDPLLFSRRRIDFEGPERAARESYFRHWLSKHQIPN